MLVSGGLRRGRCLRVSHCATSTPLSVRIRVGRVNGISREAGAAAGAVPRLGVNDHGAELAKA